MVENSYYERKIKYLDLMESGERTGSAGFVKIEVKGMGISLLVNVKGLHPTDTYEREVTLQTGEGEVSVGRITLKEGQGQFQYQMEMDHTQLRGIRIVLGGTREICCKWQEIKRTMTVEKKVVREETVQATWRKDPGKEGFGSEATRSGDKASGYGFEAPRPGLEASGSGDEAISLGLEVPGSGLEASSSGTEASSPGLEASGSGDEAISLGLEVPGQGLEASSPGLGMSRSGSDPAGGEMQSSSQRPREIQVIPWDEVKAVEESLARVEKILPKPEEEGTWRATEKTARESKKITRAAEMAAREAEKTTRGTGKATQAAGMAAREAEKTTRGTGKTMWEAEKAARRAENVTKEAQRITRAPERTTEKTTRTVKRPASGSTLGSAKRPVRLMEDKWQQIWAIYPHIHPFQDEREYLSISPADFVLLPDEAYRAANNSFLLHGYYNYDHLILTKIERRGEVSYYIGVPGNYYEREKQVAIMFGFESFECGTEPAQAGDFGYYMMRTQL